MTTGTRRFTSRRAMKLVIVVVGLISAGEAGMRLGGVIDFPVYEADARIGYIPQPNQTGVFLDKNHWQVNEKSQGSPPWLPNRNRDLLLIGDSIVWGGNPLDQAEKLGPTLQRQLSGVDVWSAAAGSWGVPNEVEYMDRFPEVVSACEDIVWVLNSGDLAGRSQWSSELTHPRHKPISALWYAVEKYGLPQLQARLPGLTAGPVPLATEPAPSFIPETEALFRERLHSLSSHARVLVVLWPDRPTTQGLETERAAYQEFARHVQEQVSRSAGQQVRVLNVLEAPGLSQDLYRDGIHPSPNGNTYLAGLIAAAIRTNGP